MKIVILDGYTTNPGDLSWDELKEYGDLTVYSRTSQEDIVERAKDADIVLTNKVVLDAGKLHQLTKLKYIGVLGTGYNVVDIKQANEDNVIVTNIPAYSMDSVAQMTFALILNMTNRVAHYANKNRMGRWSNDQDFCYWDTSLHELAGKVLGVVGLGHIGQKVAHLALDFGMDVFAYTSKNSADLPDGIRKTTLDGLFAASDILTLHCPLTKNTAELINRDSLAKMKDGSILINTSRGPLINEIDVAEALKSGKLLYYGADVMCQEPPAADNPLLLQKNAFITPHIAWATFEARMRLIEICVSNVKAFVEGTPINVVNQ